MVWRDFDHASTNLGIKRELIRTQVKENEECRIKLEELINSGLVILSDIARENPNMDVLNNTKIVRWIDFIPLSGFSMKSLTSNID